MLLLSYLLDISSRLFYSSYSVAVQINSCLGQTAMGRSHHLCAGPKGMTFISASPNMRRSAGACRETEQTESPVSNAEPPASKVNKKGLYILFNSQVYCYKLYKGKKRATEQCCAIWYRVKSVLYRQNLASSVLTPDLRHRLESTLSIVLADIMDGCCSCRTWISVSL